MTYEVNSQNAISETLDGETILINIKSGNYYSMNETASLIWQSIAARHSVESIPAVLGAAYIIDAIDLEASIQRIVDMLKNDDLIQETADTNTDVVLPAVEHKKAFIEPKIEKYEEMREMLLADPIHDVAEVGWPKLKEDK